MIILNNPSWVLKVELLADTTDNDLSCTVSEQSFNTTSGTLSEQKLSATFTEGTTPVELLRGGLGSVRTKVEHISIHNDDTEEATVKVTLTDGVDTFTLCRAVLAVNGTLQFNSDSGWQTLDPSGVPVVAALLASNDLSDVADAATAFGNIKQAATTSATGVAELATSAETITGTDTVRVVTPAGFKAALDAVRIIRETPTGSINGSNTAFTTANSRVAGTEEVFLDGLLQTAGGVDYTATNATTITFAVAPATNSILRINYHKA